jgi:hypothetical protein
MKKIIIISIIVLLIIISSFLFINSNKKEKIEFIFLDDSFFHGERFPCISASNFLEVEFKSLESQDRNNRLELIDKIEFIIHNEDEYQQLLKYEGGYSNWCENYTLPYIDFSEKTLIGKLTVGGGCSAKYNRDLILDEKNNKIIYYLKAEFHGNCHALYSGMNWVLIDKKYSDYEIEFRNKDLRDNYFLVLTIISLIILFLISLYMIYSLYNENKENLKLFLNNMGLSFSLVSGLILIPVSCTFLIHKLLYSSLGSENFFVNLRQVASNLMTFFVICIIITILILIYSKIKGHFKTNFFLSLLLIIENYLLLMSSFIHLHSNLGTIIYLFITVLISVFIIYILYLFFKNYKKYNSLFKITNMFLLYCFIFMPLFFYFNSKSYLISFFRVTNMLWFLIPSFLITLVYGFYSIVFFKERNKLALPSIILPFFLIIFTLSVIIFVFSNLI